MALWASVRFTNRVNAEADGFHACPMIFHSGDLLNILGDPWMDSCPAEVTILTGFLGAGKTTLLNYILQAPTKESHSICSEMSGAWLDNVRHGQMQKHE